MAIVNETYKLPKIGLRATLLDEVEDTSNGEWVNTEGFERSSIHVIIADTATVQVRASNEIAPAASDDGGLVEEKTASGFVQLRAPARWVKAKISAHTSGKVSAFMQCVP